MTASPLGAAVSNADDLWMRDDARWLVMLGGGAWDLNPPSPTAWRFDNNDWRVGENWYPCRTRPRATPTPAPRR
ncbi:MAG TPA: hypothetical protein VMW19_07215 [Myxococcota bacterium]|nr:hypothetical protein [Myxococcota bacterium]